MPPALVLAMIVLLASCGADGAPERPAPPPVPGPSTGPSLVISGGTSIGVTERL